MKLVISLFLFIFLILSYPEKAAAQESIPPHTDVFYRAKVIEILNYGETITEMGSHPFQEVKLKVLDGDKKGEEITIQHGKYSSLTQDMLVNVGETIVLTKTSGPD